jgi:hypothetical protein
VRKYRQTRGAGNEASEALPHERRRLAIPGLRGTPTADILTSAYAACRR